MLDKTRYLEVEDILSRKYLIPKFSDLILDDFIVKKEHDGKVVALDAPWGCGKTTFVLQWIDDLKSREKIDTIYYNAWDNDDFNSAFIPIMTAIYQMLGKKNALAKKLADGAGSIMTFIGLGINQIIAHNRGINIRNLAKQFKEYYTNCISKYEDFIKEKKQFKDDLANIIPEGGKTIIFIDELDRCRPTFAINTLEAVKHFYDVEDLIFVFSVDLDQLSHSIKMKYGSGMDTAGYLARFFDISFALPQPKFKDYLNHLIKDCKALKFISNDDIESLSKTCQHLKLTLRDMNIVVSAFNVFCGVYSDIKSYPQAVEIYFYLICIKFKNPNIYNTMINDSFINEGNSPGRNVDYQMLLKRYYSFSGTIRSLIDRLSNNNNQTRLADIKEAYSHLFAFNDIQDDSQLLREYLTNKLGIISFLK